MKKIWKGLFCTFILVLLSFQSVQAQEAFIIDHVLVEMNVHEDGFMEVSETFQLDFSEERHGMYRYIPNTYSMKMEEDGVTSTKKYYFPVSDIQCSTSCEINGNADGVVVKLGDADKTIYGKQTFVISYHVQTKDLRLKNNEQALYWNLLSGFDTTTKSLSYKITMPKPIDEDKIYTYTNDYGAVDTMLSAHVSGNVIEGELSGSLWNNQNATILVNLPKDYFAFAPVKDTTFIASLICGVLLLLCAFLFVKFGKDEELIVTVEFNAPEGIDSAQAGFIIDDSAQNKDIISLIIDWANRGFIKIHDKEEGFELEKIKNMDEKNSMEYERTFFRAIFEKKDLVNEEDIKDQKVGESLLKSKRQLTNYFNSDPKKRIYQSSSIFLQILMSIFMAVPGIVFIWFAGNELFGLLQIYVYYMIPSALIGVSGVAWFFLMRNRYVLKRPLFVLLVGACMVLDLVLLGISAYMQSLSGVSWMGIIISTTITVCLLVLMIFMDKRSEQGNIWLGKLIGFKEFILSCEKDQLELLVEENPSAFYHILPYAYVMGISDVWVKKFEKIAIVSPDWYDGYNGNLFTTVLWWNHFHYCFSNISTATSYIPPTSGHGGGSFGGGFGGGGFAGGGFGGGGGGSW